MGSQAKKILVVEDERPIAKAMELKLQQSGFDVLVAFNGEDALGILEKENFDLIIADLIMPKMDGFTFLKNLKNSKNQTPVIISSNLSQEEDFKKVKEMGAVGYFIKSNTPINKLVEEVRKIVK